MPMAQVAFFQDHEEELQDHELHEQKQIFPHESDQQYPSEMEANWGTSLEVKVPSFPCMNQMEGSDQGKHDVQHGS